MTGYGTLTGVTAEEFGAQVRQRREVRRLSRRDLAQRSGVSYGALDKLESQNPPKPRRVTAIDLAIALDWDVDDALAVLDYEPLSDDERAGLGNFNDLRTQLDRMWDELPLSQQAAIVALVRSILNPQAIPREASSPGPSRSDVNVQYFNQRGRSDEDGADDEQSPARRSD